MSKLRKYIWFYGVTIVYFATFAVSFALGITGNPDFSINDFFMGLASELVGIVFAVLIVDNYIRLKTERAMDKKRTKTAADHNGSSAEGIAIADGGTAVKSITTLIDNQTGIKYLLVLHENGSAMSPLLDGEGKPLIEERL